MAAVIKFPERPPKIELGTGGDETIGSLLARKRFMEGPRPATKRRIGSLATRKARNAIQRDADTMESCLLWLFQIAKADHDPRAIATMIEHWDNYTEFNPLNSHEDCERVLKMIGDVIAEYKKRFPIPPPRLVK